MVCSYFEYEIYHPLPLGSAQPVTFHGHRMEYGYVECNVIGVEGEGELYTAFSASPIRSHCEYFVVL
jgi:hypothetical protein